LNPKTVTTSVVYEIFFHLAPKPLCLSGFFRSAGTADSQATKNNWL
jgi:hypothetical protein